MAKQKHGSAETTLTITAMLHLHKQNYSVSKENYLKPQSLSKKKLPLFTTVEVQFPTTDRQTVCHIKAKSVKLLFFPLPKVVREQQQKGYSVRNGHERA